MCCIKYNYFRVAPKSPEGWGQCVHPEGILYHRKEEKLEGLAFLTDTDVSQSDILESLESTIENIRGDVLKAMKEWKLDSTTGKSAMNANTSNTLNRTFVDVVLEGERVEEGEGKGTLKWKYYLADHKSQHLFWLHRHTLHTSIYKGAESQAHIGDS